MTWSGMHGRRTDIEEITEELSVHGNKYGVYSWCNSSRIAGGRNGMFPSRVD